MKIKEYISSPDFSDKLVEVDQLLLNAKPSVSFWGQREVAIDGYEGSISVDELSRKILDVGEKRCKADDLTNRERVSGIEITKKMRNFYQITDDQISQRNWFTRLLNAVREFSFWPYTPRFHAEMGFMEDYFRAYSENRYIQEFGDEKDIYNIFYKNSD